MIEKIYKKIFGRSIRRVKQRRVTKKIDSNYLQQKETARSIIVPRVEFWAQKMGVTYNRVAIRNQKTRWGSCSAKGNLNFNYRIAFLPTKMMDYVIVHELCHLKEMNHSSRFWALVAGVLPDYKRIHNEMKAMKIK
ncbi:hypothetical protein CSB37_02450 [bacterium DOLZORAL124_38_8]|nr:MAG: hypothetical protein CSB37_02450 [bacterium DOLZORAL124_38_8]